MIAKGIKFGVERQDGAISTWHDVPTRSPEQILLEVRENKGWENGTVLEAYLEYDLNGKYHKVYLECSRLTKVLQTAPNKKKKEVMQAKSGHITFPTFWYESNACYGDVESLEDLAEKARLVLEEPNTIATIDHFLDNSVKAEGDALNFGTRREHTSKHSLRQFLAYHGILDEFLVYFNSLPAPEEEIKYGQKISPMDLFMLDVKSNEFIKKYREGLGLETPNNRIDTGDLKMIVLALQDLGFDVVERVLVVKQ